MPTTRAPAIVMRLMIIPSDIFDTRTGFDEREVDGLVPWESVTQPAIHHKLKQNKQQQNDQSEKKMSKFWTR
jgi:hypothetical protein